MRSVAALALTSTLVCGCATLESGAEVERGYVDGHIAKVRQPHPIEKRPRWVWYYFDTVSGHQIIVYSNLYLPCSGVTRVVGGWMTITAMPEPGGGPPRTERQFFSNNWKCL